MYLGLGSNLGDRLAFLQAAIRELGADSRFTLRRRAGVYWSTALGAGAGSEFLNTAVAGLWDGTPEALLDLCQAVERAHGRTRPYPWAPRTLDIDILWWEGRDLDTPRLRVPHPRLRERAFALVPLLEIGPHLTDVRTGEPLSRSLTPQLLEQGFGAYAHGGTSTGAARV